MVLILGGSSDVRGMFTDDPAGIPGKMDALFAELAKFAATGAALESARLMPAPVSQSSIKAVSAAREGSFCASESSPTNVTAHLEPTQEKITANSDPRSDHRRVDCTIFFESCWSDIEALSNWGRSLYVPKDSFPSELERDIDWHVNGLYMHLKIYFDQKKAATEGRYAQRCSDVSVLFLHRAFVAITILLGDNKEYFLSYRFDGDRDCRSILRRWQACLEKILHPYGLDQLFEASKGEARLHLRLSRRRLPLPSH